MKIVYGVGFFEVDVGRVFAVEGETGEWTAYGIAACYGGDDGRCSVEFLVCFGGK